jgi:hypothetical protein
MTLKRLKTFAKAAVLLVVLTQSNFALAQDGAMSPQAIESAWVGKTVIGTIGSGPLVGKQMQLTMKRDGSITIDGAVVDTGTWRLSDQGYCATWKKIRAGQERCFTVVRKGTEQVVNNPDGSLNSTVTEIR